MKNRTVTFILSGVVIVYFVVYFYMMYGVADKGEGLSQLLDQLEERAANNEWDEASQIMTKVYERWRVHSRFIAFNFGEQDYSNMVETLKTIEGGIQAKDPPTVLPNILVAKNYWKNMQSVVPEP